MTDYVMIHGAWHGSWCWKRVRDLLTAEGHRVFTPTLTGLGERCHLLSRDVGLDTHITDIVNFEETAAMTAQTPAPKIPLTPEDTGYFTEETSADIVIGRIKVTDERFREVMSAVIRHLHQLVKEVEPSQAEWMAAIEFLTRTGQMCTDWCQEYILLSDTLGVSMLVDAIHNRKPSGATETTVLGPFYVSDAPRYDNGANICLDGKGQPLLVRGRVTDTEGRPVAGALLDVWQTNEDGFYDVQQKGVQPDMNLRGVFRTDAEGRYWFRSVKPRSYAVPSDGPVGQLLDRMGRHPYRPAHIHFIARAEGFEPITTHIFSSDCPYLHSDTVFGVKESLIADYRQADDPGEAAALGLPNPFWTVESDFVLARPGARQGG